MDGAITVELLRGAYGDALWIECARAGRPWRMVVDGGPPQAASALAARLDAVPPGERVIDVVVVSHIDSDHIGGMFPLLVRNDLVIGDVWFNGLPQLPQDHESSTRSVAEGEDLVELLTGVTSGNPLPWNRVVGGRALMTDGDRAFRELPLLDGPRITLLSPTPRRLRALRRMWKRAMTCVHRGESEEVGPITPLEPLADLHAVAAADTANDTSIPNGSSIAFLLEHRGASCLLAADAFPSVLEGALWALVNARGGRPLSVDAVKLPHHGSEKNVGRRLMTLVSTKHFLISTNGERFGHPDDVSLARAVTGGGRGTTLWFNYGPTAKTSRWADPDMSARYGFITRFAESADGTRLELPERS